MSVPAAPPVSPQANPPTGARAGDAAQPADSELTLRLEPPEAFETLRALFTATHYDDATVARRLGGQTMIGAPRMGDGRSSMRGAVEDANAALIRLFIDGEPLPTALLQELIGDEALSACRDLGLLAPAVGDPASLAPTVFLTPVQGIWLASDVVPTGAGIPEMRQDFVYSANNELTGHFLSCLPDVPQARTVELCAGTGVAAIRAARGGATSVVAADLVPRCVHFARFNAHLNGVEDRVRVVQSDAWDGIDGEPFDLVVAHPPYVPALAHRFDFRDAGEDGEQVTRRIVEGIPAHVRRGGRVVLRTALSDRRGATIAQRVRAWLGEASLEFDLVQLEALEYGTMDAYRSVTKGGRDFVDCERWLRHFETLEIERFAICILELRRDAFGRAPITERRVLGGASSPAVADWHFRWGRFVAGAGATPEERLAGHFPRVAPGVRVAVHLEKDAEGGWQTVGASIETNWPTRGVVKAPALAPTLLELCDGTRDVDGILAGLRSAGLVDEGVGRGEVAHIVEVLAAAGAVAIAPCPIPAPPGGTETGDR